MHCSSCGATIADGPFCPSCGSPISASALPPDALRRPLGVTLLALLNFVAGAAYAIAGAAYWVNEGHIDPAAPVVALVGLALGGLHVTCGTGLWGLRSWGRVLQLVLSFIGLLAIPLGTLISIAILIYLFQERIRVLFSSKPRDALTPQEIQALLTKPKTAMLIAVTAAVGVVFVVFTGIIAAIAIPNFLNAIDRGKQKRTMADMRSIGTAIEEYAIDHNAYPEASSVDDLTRELADYLVNVPQTDGWGHEWIVKSDVQRYAICSSGRDGGDCELLGEGGPTENFHDSIIFADGQFLQWPEGMQQ